MLELLQFVLEGGYVLVGLVGGSVGRGLVGMDLGFVV